jgi:hypothetical protein
VEWIDLLLGLLELLSELAVSLGPDLFCERVAQRSRRKQTKSPPATLTAVCGYIALGASIGFLSVLLVPSLFIPPGWGRFLNLVITPLVCGAVMANIGRLRQRKGEPLVRLDRFPYGWLLAFSIAGTRLILGK